MTRQGVLLTGLIATVAFLLGLVAAGTRTPARFGGALASAPSDASAARTSTLAPAGAADFSLVAARINAAVVNVDTATRGDEREGAGSGFIIDPAGFILTNNHVIAGTDRVTVTLADGRAFRAEVFGTDPAIDVALLHVDAHEPLPVAPLGTSDVLRVGQWVCAIGNPLGVYAHSVTVGVVSFLGRTLFDPALDAYIQTDAAISFGNSGGPLIDARGAVVGMTTAISAQAMNIGFAIPIDQVTAVLPRLRQRGVVEPGDVGMGVITLTPELRQALAIAVPRGAVVQDVAADSAAARAGARPYDVVTAIDGRAVDGAESLVRAAADLAPGTVVTIDLMRDGAPRRITLTLGVRRASGIGRGQTFRASDARTAAQEQAPLGINVRDLDAETASDLRLPDATAGVIVTAVDAAGPARLAHVQATDVILEVNRRPVRSASEFRSLAAAVRPGEPVALLVYDKFTAVRTLRTVVADPAP